MKVTLGSAANAQAAADMVARVRTILIGRAGNGYPPHDLCTASTFGPGPGAIRGWREELALDSAASSFTFHAVYGATVAVKNVSDGIVYKVMKDPAGGWYATEKANFDALNALSKSWLCDYWYYDTPKVMAIRAYALLDPYGPQLYSQRPAGAPPEPPQYTVPASAQAALADMKTTGVRYSTYSVGLDGANNLFLIDACI